MPSFQKVGTVRIGSGQILRSRSRSNDKGPEVGSNLELSRNSLSLQPRLQSCAFGFGKPFSCVNYLFSSVKLSTQSRTSCT
jgi:hypothetical protein